MKKSIPTYRQRYRYILHTPRSRYLAKTLAKPITDKKPKESFRFLSSGLRSDTPAPADHVGLWTIGIVIAILISIICGQFIQWPLGWWLSMAFASVGLILIFSFLLFSLRENA